MIVIVGALAVVFLNLAGYFLYLRRRLMQDAEGAVLKYHVVSFCLTAAICGALAVSMDRDGFAAWVAAVCLHAIFSMSFLELWSVSEGSFFLAVMDRLVAWRKTGGGQPFDVSPLAEIGRRKRINRLDALLGKGWIAEKNGMLSLTGTGRAVAGAFNLLRWIMHVRKSG